ncbi:hypothetical protein BPNPMPFG_002474 [Mesorhizobium sp. AR07]|uniref:hypothetical protein n=1 Tax=Mesorhizobium sp. AR07 TaxID=2865838 RepID=UPI0021602327|nr:hypothetical protein [Mesorhizobium sp. AR07]UVK46766.1 hypothetical protein BPNPMPFG_002474 [Mesorhizobium sp. AR07]
MNHDHAISLITLARHAYRQGFVISADVYMRQLLACANRLPDKRHRAAIFVIRNKMRPRVRAALNHVAVDIMSGA